MVLSCRLEPANLLFHHPLGREVAPEEELADVLTLLCTVVLEEQGKGEVTPACRRDESRGLNALDARDAGVTVDSECLHELLIVLGEGNII